MQTTEKPYTDKEIQAIIPVLLSAMETSPTPKDKLRAAELLVETLKIQVTVVESAQEMFDSMTLEDGEIFADGLPEETKKRLDAELRAAVRGTFENNPCDIEIWPTGRGEEPIFRVTVNPCTDWEMNASIPLSKILPWGMTFDPKPGPDHYGYPQWLEALEEIAERLLAHVKANRVAVDS